MADNIRNKPTKIDQNPELRFLKGAEYDFNIQVKKLRFDILFFRADDMGSTYHINLMIELIEKDLER